MWAAGMPQPEEPSPQGSWTPEWIEQALTEERKFILEVASGPSVRCSKSSTSAPSKNPTIAP